MDIPKYKTALIVGAGEGLSASLARIFAREKIKIALAARKFEKLGALCRESGARPLCRPGTHRGPGRDRGRRLWRLPGGAASRQADAAEQAWRVPVHGRLR